MNKILILLVSTLTLQCGEFRSAKSDLFGGDSGTINFKEYRLSCESTKTSGEKFSIVVGKKIEAFSPANSNIVCTTADNEDEVLISFGPAQHSISPILELPKKGKYKVEDSTTDPKPFKISIDFTDGNLFVEGSDKNAFVDGYQNLEGKATINGETSSLKCQLLKNTNKLSLK